jgi:hypothetical protein
MNYRLKNVLFQFLEHDISELVKVNKQFQINYNRREKYTLEVKMKKEEQLQPHVIHCPLYFEYCNG